MKTSLVIVMIFAISMLGITMLASPAYAQTTPSITIPSGQTVSVTTTPATFTIGNTTSDEIQVEVVGVEIDDLTCFNAGASFASVSFSDRIVTVTYDPGTSGSNTLSLICSDTGGTTASSAPPVDVTITVNVPAATESITIPSGQTVSVTTTPATFTIGNTVDDDIQIELVGVTLDDFQCSNADNTNKFANVTISGRIITLTYESGTVATDTLGLICSSGSTTSGDPVNVTFSANIPAAPTPSITIENQTINIGTSDTNLLVGASSSCRSDNPNDTSRCGY